MTQSSPAYSFLYLSNFLSFHTLKNDIFVKDFSTTMQARILIFGMLVDDDLLYRGTGNHFSPAYFSLYLSNFLPIRTLKNDIFRQIFLKNHARQECSYLVCRLMMTCFIMGLRTILLLLILLVFVHFSFLPYFE